MSKRTLPKAEFNVRPGMQTTASPQALDRWRPEVQAKDEGADNTISVLDVIGQDVWTGEGVTLNRISAALRQIGPRDVTVNINSPGGNLFEGLAIYNALRDHPGKITVKVLGIAASAASVIAMAGDEIQIARAGFFMIHNAWVRAEGDRHAFAEVAAWLEPFDAVINDIYAARTGLDPKAIGKMLDREQWIGGTDAVAQKFADSFLPADQVESGAQASTAARSVKAERQVDEILARAGVARSERRSLLAAMKGGTRNAAATDMPGAVVGEVQEILARLKAI